MRLCLTMTREAQPRANSDRTSSPERQRECVKTQFTERRAVATWSFTRRSTTPTSKNSFVEKTNSLSNAMRPGRYRSRFCIECQLACGPRLSLPFTRLSFPASPRVENGLRRLGLYALCDGRARNQPSHSCSTYFAWHRAPMVLLRNCTRPKAATRRRIPLFRPRPS
jgi:hypothetical protein